MAKQSPILKIEAAPGDAPRGIEQLDGDLLVPAGARPVIERALRLAQQALAPSQREELAALAEARLLLYRNHRHGPAADGGEPVQGSAHLRKAAEPQSNCGFA